jgi:hypothetical protein
MFVVMSYHTKKRECRRGGTFISGSRVGRGATDLRSCADCRTVTQVCIVGTDDVDLRYELLSRETSRAALATYDLHEPFENAVAVDTVSLGVAVALLNDLNWYLVRFADWALVREPSISTEEWLTRGLAERVRDGGTPPDETGSYLRVYGVVDGELVEPMYATRVDSRVPEYDLREVDDTVVVRVTESEFGG